MNVIKEDLTRLRREKERYLKQDKSYKKAMSLSTDTSLASEPDFSHKEAIEELRRQHQQNNKSLSKKVEIAAN